MGDEPYVIHSYTKENAIEDGALVDVTEQAKETGIILPTVITDHLHRVLEEIPQRSTGQDWRGRLHDVLWMTFLKLKAMQTLRDAEFPVEIEVILDGKTETLWAVAEA